MGGTKRMTRCRGGTVTVVTEPDQGLGPVHGRTRHRAVGLLLVGVLALTGCGAVIGQQPVNGTSGAVPSGTAPTGPGPVVSNGHGWTAAGLEGPTYASETCHAGTATYMGQTQPLPDPHCTPGAIDPTVTQANLVTTICRSGGYTTTVRPPEAFTSVAKREAMRAYGITGSVRGYEMDHDIALAIGGSSSTQNLWVEQNVGGTGGFIINAKDQVEDDLHAAVCSGHTTLAAAQNAIAANWTTAEQTLGVTHG